MSYTSRILIVEDDAALRSFLVSLLTQNGYATRSCASGREAMIKLGQDAYDLVILDICLPDMDGFQVIESLDSKGPLPLFIAITGNATIESAVAALRKGAYDFLRKPIENNELIARIENALDYKRLLNERKHAEIAIAESDLKFRKLVAHLQVGIYILQNEKIVFANQILKEIFRDYSGSLDHEIHNYIARQDALDLQDAYTRLKSEEIETIELTVRFSPAGRPENPVDLKWLHYRGAKIEYQNQDAIIFNIVDITKTKELEQQLIVKNKMISLGRVAAGIAHEIRNPLTGINNYLYALERFGRNLDLDTEEAEKLRQIVDRMHVASGTIEAIIKRVMDFSRPGFPNMVFADVNTSLKKVMNLSAATLKKMEIDIKESFDVNIPRCYIDPGLIEQVMYNLIGNSSEAMREANGLKLIELKSCSKNGSVLIRVSDSGTGISNEFIDRIFDPFFTTKDDGNGIGLNIAQRIIADHNGSIAVGTSKWGGAEFTIELPVERRINPR